MPAGKGKKGKDAPLYADRGVSANKSEVKAAIAHLDPGLFPTAFCKILPDIAGDPDYCSVIHSDSAGTKASLAYMYFKETGTLSVFRGSFSLAAAEQVSGAAPQEISALVDQSLLERRGNNRFAIHELLRIFGKEKLRKRPDDRRTLRDRHCAFYSSVIQTGWAQLKGHDQLLALAQIRSDFENVLAAWNWALERRQVHWLAQALDGMCTFYDWCGRYEEGDKACQSAMQVLEEPATADSTRLVARLLAWRSLLLEKLGLIEEAARFAHDSLSRLDAMGVERIDIRKERAFALRQCGRVSFHTDLPAARRSAEESLVLFREMGDLWSQALVRLPGSSVPLPGFGASDCRLGCLSHLVAFPGEGSGGSPLLLRPIWLQALERAAGAPLVTSRLLP